MLSIPFNKPYFTGNETKYIEQAVAGGKISGDGVFTQKCHQFFEDRYGFKKCLLTTSCTDALEMAAILLDIQPGDEVIMPSFTFVSTANAFVLRGAVIKFVDSNPFNPNLDVEQLEALITTKTKAIVVVHYAGICCDMEVVMQLAGKHNLFVVEDAAQAIESFFQKDNRHSMPLGSIGHLAAFSFHETKNIVSGEGGMLVINDERFVKRAEIIREKGTNRSSFFRGEVDKYGWVDVGSSFLPSDVIAAFLYAQLENLERIQEKRISIWQKYYALLTPLKEQGLLELPVIPRFATNNGHMFYILCKSLTERSALIEHLKKDGILSVFHYISLHRSMYYNDKHNGRTLQYTDYFSDVLLRLPLYFELTEREVLQIFDSIQAFFKLNRNKIFEVNSNIAF